MFLYRLILLSEESSPKPGSSSLSKGGCMDFPRWTSSSRRTANYLWQETSSEDPPANRQKTKGITNNNTPWLNLKTHMFLFNTSVLERDPTSFVNLSGLRDHIAPTAASPRYDWRFGWCWPDHGGFLGCPILCPPPASPDFSSLSCVLNLIL